MARLRFFKQSIEEFAVALILLDLLGTYIYIEIVYNSIIIVSCVCIYVYKYVYR